MPVCVNLVGPQQFAICRRHTRLRQSSEGQAFFRRAQNPNVAAVPMLQEARTVSYYHPPIKSTRFQRRSGIQVGARGLVEARRCRQLLKAVKRMYKSLSGWL